ncbi:MAG: hypothetical protein AAFV93_01995 [Chloroflexota bacterium]
MSGFDLMMYIKYENAMRFNESDPDETIRRLEDIRQEAIDSENLEWRIIADHWITQTYINWKKDYLAANKQAVASAVEYSKPNYAHFREYICVQNDLMLVYEGIDPVGYADQIKQAIELTIGMTTPDMSCHFCMNREIIDYYRHTGQDGEARDQCAEFFAMTHNQPHYRIQAYEHLAKFAYEDAKWNDLAQLANAGADLATEQEDDSAWIGLKCYQMLALYHLGQQEQAHQLHGQIEYRVKSLKMVQGYDYYHITMVYYEAQGKLDLALKTVSEYISTLENTGRIFWECKARLEHIRLLKLADQSHDDALAQFHNARQQLKAQNQFDEQLANILQA